MLVTTPTFQKNVISTVSENLTYLKIESDFSQKFEVTIAGLVFDTIDW